MRPTRFGRTIRRTATFAAIVGLLSGCASSGQFSTRTTRIGADDGNDVCRQQLVALDSTGNFFGEDILTGAAVGAATGGLAGALIGGNLKGALIGAAAGGVVGGAGGYFAALQQQQKDQAGMLAQMQGDLSRENAQIDRTQLAFDQLSDCRFRAAEAVRANLRAGYITRAVAEAQMADLKQRSQRDLALAQTINQQIAKRGSDFEIAADNVVPGSRAPIPPPPTRAVLRQAAPLKLRPDPAAPDIGQPLRPRQPVTVAATRSGYALVETADGARGYVPVSGLQGPTPKPTVLPTPAESGDVRTLAGSNAARRDNFAESVAVTEHAAATGFELPA
jgi:hypothetical protein